MYTKNGIRNSRKLLKLKLMYINLCNIVNLFSDYIN